MKSKLILGILSLFVMLPVASCMEKVDAGCEGIKVNLLEQLTSGLEYPQTIVESVNAKNKAIQQAMQVENEVKVAEAQAKKLIVAAEAEKKANELRQQALTPEILEKMWIEKWDGALPVYGQVPTIFKDISK